MTERARRQRTVLLMWDHLCHYSPLWSRSDDLDIGPIDAARLGISTALREELAAWNRRIERIADWEMDPGVDLPPDDVDAAEAYLLAARVQRELGETWTVWCCGGGGDGGLRDPGALGYRLRFDGPQLVLRGSGLIEWTPDGERPMTVALPAQLAGRIARWSAEPHDSAEHRAGGLELAAHIRAELRRGTVLWFGGDGVPE